MDACPCWATTDGVNSVDMNGFSPGSISQDIATNPGSVYTVLFDLAGNPGSPQGVKTLEISAAGASAIFAFDTTGKSGATVATMGWVEESFSFTATGAITTLLFTSLYVPAPFVHPDRAQGAAVDNIRVTAGHFFFTEPFDGPDEAPNLEDPDSAFTVAGGAISNTAVAISLEANRHSVRTLRTDYNTADWIYTIDFDLGSAGEIVYIGLGSGIPDPGWLREPGNSVHFRIHSSGIDTARTTHAMVRGPLTTGAPGWDSIATVGHLPSDGAFTARIVKTGSNLAFSIDGVTGVTNVPLPSFLDDTNSRLFFGNGNAATTYDNMVVAPVPTDTTPPVITAPADIAVEAISLLGQAVAIGTATASDTVDPAPAITNDAPAIFPLGTTLVTWTATDASGNSASAPQNVTVQDTTPPTPVHAGPFSVDEGSSILLDGTGSTDNLAVQSTAWDIDGDGFDDGDPSTFNGIDDSVNNVSLQVIDHAGNVSIANTTVTVNNVAPTIDTTTAPTDPQAVNTSVGVTVDFTDPGTLDTHTVTIAWDDGTPDTSTTVGPGIRTVTLNHTYTAATVATLTVTVTDDDGGTATVTYQFVVIYDPSGGFVTGGGWIDSPAGACQLTAVCQDATGKASFGFVAKYKPGKLTPDGNTQFNFKAGNLNFHSSDYAWLVISGFKAQYRGTGTINGAGNYGFLVVAYDGDRPGGDGIDRFRIKIWDIDDGNKVVYDNRMGASDDIDSADPQEVSKGSIVIHTKD